MRIALVSVFFNPARFVKPVQNFAAFLKHMQQHGGVHVVEQVLPGRQSELAQFPQGMCSFTVLSGGAVCWQKERLVNAVLPKLLADYDAVAWLDGDLIFPEPDLLGRIERAFANSDLVQLFSHSFRMGPSWSSKVLGGESPMFAGQAAYGVVFGGLGLGLAPEHTDIGLAWGATREWLLKADGLFDLGVLGGGDWFMLRACSSAIYPGITERFDDCWGAFRAKVKGTRVGHVPGSAFHLHHGSVANRRYDDRYEIARRWAFDPRFDIKQDSGLWTWASDKPGLHAEVKEYFEGRREDESGS